MARKKTKKGFSQKASESKIQVAPQEVTTTVTITGARASGKTLVKQTEPDLVTLPVKGSA